jgi:arabinogalactan endo-1,4-beta-galactosidase
MAGHARVLNRALLALALAGCGSSPSGTGAGTGGSPGTGGSSPGTGGLPGTGGTSPGTGGSLGTGGTPPGSGGLVGTGGKAPGTGGAAGAAGGRGGGGGHAGGGAAGHASGGTAGAGTGNAGGGPTALYIIGADITDQETAPSAAQDDLLSQMKTHGFNWIRLRTFVDPKASDGYDKTNGYDDITHTTTFGKKVKDAGFGLLVDFHMSDNWADPGKQCVPVSWQGYTTITDLASALHDYVKASITTLIADGARPDMVQIGNETTPGMLLHLCDSGGQPTGNAPIQGAASSAGWPNLGMLLKAGVAGVREVDPTILVSFHIDKGGTYSTSKSWLDSAIKQGATPDAFGESCYQQYQGDTKSVTNTVNGWTSTFTQLVAAYPSIRFFAAEYGPMERQINDVVFALPPAQGMGTFNWEPTTQGDWNAAQPTDASSVKTHALFQRSGNTYTTLPDISLYDQMMKDYAARL